MPNCYICKRETPVTRFYLLRVFMEYGYMWYYTCSLKCLKALVLDKVYGEATYLLREYMDTCGKGWVFKTGDELRKFIATMRS